MRIALVMNSHAGSLDDPEALTGAIRERCDELTVHEIGEEARAAATNPDRLIVAGGDGSLGAAFAAAHRAHVTLGVIPAGTANDFARALDLPPSLAEAIDLVTAPSPVLRDIWGGQIDDRPFVNVASVGLAVDAAAYAEAHKSRLGPLAYAVGAAQAGAFGSRVRASVAVDGSETATGPVWQIIVGASGRFGGGSGLGEADPAHPRLTTAWVPAGSRLTLPVRAAGLRSQTIERQAGVQWWHAERLEIHAVRGGRPAAWNVDGERYEPQTATTRLQPIGPVTVIAPR